VIPLAAEIYLCLLALRVDLVWDGGVNRDGNLAECCLGFGLFFGCRSGSRSGWELGAGEC
jgi:hypothetical protein